jgi:hypothetical protein
MKKTIPVLLLLVFWSHSALAAEYLHPKLKSKEVTVRTVALLPVKVDIRRNSVKGGESMLRESEAIAGGVAALISRLFGSLGLTIVEEAIAVPAGGDAVAADDDARRATLVSLQSRFEALAPQLMAKPKDVTKGRFTLGDEVAGLVPGGTDALVFVRGRGVVNTKAKSFLSGGLVGMVLDKGTLQCDLVVVNARTGDVLFFSRTVGSGDIVKAAGGQVEKPLSKSLKKLALRS